MHFTLNDIIQNVGETTYLRGLEYAREDRVLTLNQSGAAIDAVVMGSGRNVYSQEIDVSQQDNLVGIDGRCSCPVQHNCKHVAAALIEFLRKQQFDAPKAALARVAPRPAEPLAVPYQFSAWLNRLEGALASACAAGAAEPKKAISHCLLFILVPAQAGARVSLSACKARLRADGTIGATDPIRDLPRTLAGGAAFLEAGDEDLLRLYAALHGSTHYFEIHAEPRGKIGAQLLRAVVDAGKLYWANSFADAGKGKLSRFKAGPARDARLAWQMHENSLRLGWRFDAPDGAPGHAVDHVLATDPHWYIDNLACGELGLQPPRPPEQSLALLQIAGQTPALDPDDALALSRALLARGLAQFIPIPSTLREVALGEAEIDVMLYLDSAEQRRDGGSAWHDFARLTFSYDGQQVSAGSGGEPILRQGRNGIERIVRDAAAEQRALQRLHECGFTAAAPGHPAPGALVLPDAAAWMRFAGRELAELQALGWHIRKQPNYRFDLAEVEEWYAAVDEAGQAQERNAWFELELGIVVNRKRVPLLPVLVDLIRSAPVDFDPQTLAQHDDGEPLLARLPDGTRVALPWGRIKPILNTLGELYFTERAGAGLRLSALDAARLAELSDATHMRWLGGERLRGIGGKLREFGGVRQVAPPQGLRGALRDYQSEGLAWMQFLREYDLAGILADDMGLGKTIQTLAHILVEKEAGRLDHPALVVAPTSLMSNWQEEAARFAPGLRVLVLQGATRGERFDRVGECDLVLTTYALLPRDEELLRQHEFHLVILDEAHYIKNARSKAAQTAGLLRARHRLCLTGTPLENHLGELWSQFHFLLPGLLGDEKTFNRDFRTPIEKQRDEPRRELLSRRVKPFMLRRTKDKVAKELPPKTEMVRTVELAGAQRDLYETVRLAMDKKVRDEIARKGVARSHIVILEALLKLRQVCCDPRLVKSGAAAKGHVPSAKLAELNEMVEELLDEGRRILIFSQFTSMLELIERELQQRSIAYALLTGETRDRAGAVQAFQQGMVRVFLISLKAGGVGLNLTAADTVIHYDPWWNPAAENQASDRAWRIGQDKPVFVYKLIAKGTLEEKIQALQQKKSELAQALLSDGAAQDMEITPEDLQGIFAPLASHHGKDDI